MRVLFAGLFVFCGIGLAVSLLSGVMEHGSPILIDLGMGLYVIVLCIIALIVFNLPLRKEIDASQQLREWEEKGLIVSSEYKAVRAFQLEEFEDEGSHYFIEVIDGSVLYLNGQFLWDYEPIDDDPELNQPRRFPCTDFTLRSHRDEGFVIEMICRGEILEPEAIEPPFPAGSYRRGGIDKEVEIITDQRYDQIKNSIAGTV